MADPPDGDDVEAMRAALRESEESLSAFKAKTKKYVEKLKEQVSLSLVEELLQPKWRENLGHFFRRDQCQGLARISGWAWMLAAATFAVLTGPVAMDARL